MLFKFTLLVSAANYQHGLSSSPLLPYVLGLLISLMQQMAWKLAWEMSTGSGMPDLYPHCFYPQWVHGAPVVGCVMPHSVRHVRGMLKLAFPDTIKGNNMFLEKEPLLLFY